MGTRKGEFITAAEIESLRALIALECGGSRRGKPNGTKINESNGTLSGYLSGASSTVATKDKSITASGMNKILNAVHAASNGYAVAVQGASVKAIDGVVSKVSALAAVTDVKSSNHGCSGACTGLCSSGCYSSCTGTCDGGCYTGCSGSCKNTCSGCSGGCTSCTGQCAACGGCQGSGCTASNGDRICYHW